MFDGERAQAERLLRMRDDRAQRTDGARERAEAAAMLRSIYAPKQAAFFKPGKLWKATRKTRRAGITTVGVREMLARAIEVPGWRATYVASTRGEAEARAWRSDTKSGLVDVLLKLATPAPHATLTAYELGGVIIEVREADLVLSFSNGSEIELFGVDNLRSQRKKRGGAKHLIWIDEAQDFLYLEQFFDAVIVPMSDFGIEVWISGTPGIDCAGMFYDITKEPEDGEEPLPGWEVHELAQVDNPFFGRVVTDTTAPGGAAVYYVEDNLYADTRLTAEQRAEHRYGPFETTAEAELEAVRVRWEQTAGDAMRKKAWKGDEPQFVREFLGRWVKADARYVYPVNSLPKHVAIFAPQRLADNPFVGSHPSYDGHPRWYDHTAACRDLPMFGPNRRRHEWLFSLWMDFGFHPDPFAIVLWAFCTTLPDVYEMFSWKQTRVDSEQQGLYIKRMWDVSDAIVSFGGDAANKKSDFAVWKRRMNMPLDEADKQGKEALEELLADDIRRGVVHFREGSPLYIEMRHLVYLPTKPGKPRRVHKHRAVNGVVHGDHCCFVAGTLVATSRGALPIEDVRQGMQAHVRTGELRNVSAAFSSGIKRTWRLELDDGSTLVGTADHPIWTARGWVPLGLLMPGNEVTIAIGDDRPVLVADVQPTCREERVYNLTVDGEHEYFANGVLVSNCDAGRYGFADLTHYLSKTGQDKPPSGSPEAYAAEEARVERSIEEQDRRREERLAEQDELAAEYRGDGSYDAY